MPDLAVIIPYHGEHPHLQYTLQSVQTALTGHVDFEVIAIQNGPTQEGALGPMLEKAKANWLKRETFTEKSSHWAAKNEAIHCTSAPFLFFLDAHCLVPAALVNMFAYYQAHYRDLNGTLHLPIADFFKPVSKIYKFLCDPKAGMLHYQNIPFEPPNDRQTLEVPCMSTCGMLCRREHITHDIEFWPDELGPYGGGENYSNFCLALMGKRHHIYVTEPIRHWHIPGVWSRDYSITYLEWARNIAIATYLVGGETWLDRLLTTGRLKTPHWHPVRFLSDDEAKKIYQEIFDSPHLRNRRASIRTNAVIGLEEWTAQWA